MPAPVPVERCIGVREVAEPRLSHDGGVIGWLRLSAGAATFVTARLDATGAAEPRTFDPVPGIRAGRGLGGGAWTWLPDASGIVYAGVDGDLWSLSLRHGATRRLTAHGPERVAQAPDVTSDGRHVVHVVDQSEVWCARLPGGTGAPSRVEVWQVDDGSSDFCFDPRACSRSERVVWQAWNVPDMPWDHARARVASLAGAGGTTDARDLVVPSGSVQQPQLLPGGRLGCVRDDHGWLNVWIDGAPAVEEPFEHAGPSWGLGQRSFAISPDGARLAFTRNERGFGRLCVARLDEPAGAPGRVQEVARGVHGQLSWRGDRVAAVRTGARTPGQVVVHDVHPHGEPWPRHVVEVGPQDAWDEAWLAEPELVEVPAPGGPVHARLYRAAGAADGRTICWLHGGPTDQWQVTFMPRIAYWRSRGWHVLVPDHRGSTGHGRAYQQALRGRWGELDVDDVIAVLTHAQQRSWSAPARTVLMGGSAGGFTVLGVLGRLGAQVAPGPGGLAPPGVAAAAVAYPVTDLVSLAERSHRFERHSTVSLVGPAGSPLHHDRSPVWFAHRIRTPLLVFHGDADPVVPVEQSRVLVERVRAAGGDVELVVYPGAGHGFRDAAHQRDEYARTEAFLRRHVP